MTCIYLSLLICSFSNGVTDRCHDEGGGGGGGLTASRGGGGTATAGGARGDGSITAGNIAVIEAGAGSLGTGGDGAWLGAGGGGGRIDFM